jgi:uncharacterized lipoprotein YajG
MKWLILLVLAGCASVSSPPQSAPQARGIATQPACIIGCSISIVSQEAKSDVASDGKGDVKVGDQKISSEVSSEKSTDVKP